MKNLREEFILRSGETLLPGFRARAAAFYDRPADQLRLFNAILAAARGAMPKLDSACAAAGISKTGCASAEEIKKVPVLRREILAAGRNRAKGAAMASLESGGTGRAGRLRTALSPSGVAWRYADLLAVLKETGWRMGERVSALHPEEYGYFQNFAGKAAAGAFGELAFGFAQQYLLYGLLHNRRNLLYSGKIFSDDAAARALLEDALADDPVLLITRPDALMAALKAWRPGDRFRRLRAVLTVGTALGAAVREAAKQKFGAEVFDMYASTELGYVGLTCPLSGGLFHLNAASCLVEVAGDGGVIVTDFNNKLTPMLRYDTGDHGRLEPGPCPCGRPGPLLRVDGRAAGLALNAAGAALREIDIINLSFPEHLPFFQLYAGQDGRLALRLPAREAGQKQVLAGRIAKTLFLPYVPQASAGLRLPPSGKFCYLP